MSEKAFRRKYGRKFGADSLDVEQHCRWCGSVCLFLRKDRDALGFHGLDLFQ